MKAADVCSALDARRTVRVTYHRHSDILSLDVMRGEHVEQHVLALSLNNVDVDIHEASEAAIENVAQTLATQHNLDVSRLDVD